MENINSTDNIGEIDLTARSTGSGVTAGDIAARISVGFNQTLMCPYTVPLNKTAYVTQWSVSADKSTGSPGTIDADFRVRPASSTSLKEVFQIKNHHGIVLSGNTHFQHTFKPYFKIDSLSDIAIRCQANAGTIDVHADFDIILIDD